MSTERAVWIVCDSCGEQCPMDLGCATRREADRQARAAGWRLRVHVFISQPSVDLCPDCEPSNAMGAA